MNDLIERLEKATGADRKLDADIWALADPKAFAVTKSYRAAFVNRDWTQEEKDRQIYDTARKYAPEYTASIDAALTLVPEGWWLTLDRYIISDVNPNDPRTWRAWLKKAVGDLEGDGPVGIAKHFATAPTPAIALCIAALKARQSINAQVTA